MTTFQDPETGELLDRAELGDAAAIEELLTQHRARLRRMVHARMDDRLATCMDASDVVQETLMMAAQNLPEYLKTRPLPFYPWLRQIAWNRLVALRRRYVEVSKRDVTREQSLELSGESAMRLADQLAASETGVVKRLVRKEARDRVQSALQALGELDREIVLLRHIEAMSYVEVAATIKISETAAKQRHVRALQRLRRELGEESSGA